MEEKDYPGLYQTANQSAKQFKLEFYTAIAFYSIILILASVITFFDSISPNSSLKIISTFLFLLALATIIFLRARKPDDLWYNCRAVAESVKTRTWRWMMEAEPYAMEDNAIVRRKFITDLKTIITANKSFIKKLGSLSSTEDPISQKMEEIRSLPLEGRSEIYKNQRITEQAKWYNKNAKLNRQRAKVWFWITIILHIGAISLMLYSIKEAAKKFPINILTVAASAALTWPQSKKHSELAASYTLTLNEIILIKSEPILFNNNAEFSEYIINCENAFSREHTQWFAKKT